MIPSKIKVIFAAAMSVLGVALSAMPQRTSADETKTVEWYLEQARPYLHHSCQSAWDAAKQDSDSFIKIIGIVSAVSFYNHDFNIERLKALPEPKRKELQKEFYEEIGEHCKRNNGYLLAGVVDYALTDAIAKVAAAEK